MTQEQIKQLTDLQTNITKMEDHMQKLIKNRKRVSVHFPSSGMSNYQEKVPLDMVPGLHEQVLDLICDWWEEQLIELRKRRNALCICIADESEPRYKPVENIN